VAGCVIVDLSTFPGRRGGRAAARSPASSVCRCP
jgi:hypothetical protein